MVGFQNRFFSFQPHVHILRRYRHSRLSEGAVQSQAVVFSAQALVCLSAKSWRFVSFGRSFNFQLLWKSPSLIPTEKRQVTTLNGKNIWEFEIPFHLFAQGVSKCTPIFGLSLKNFYKNLSFHLFPLGRAKLSGVFEKFFVLQKTPSLIWTKGPKCTPIFEVF